MKKLLIILVLFCTHISIYAQKIQNAVVQQQIQNELDKRGLNQAEVEARLKSKGIDINNVRPEDVPRLEGQIQAILKELENEKKQNSKGQDADNFIDNGQEPEIDISAPAPFENKNREVKSNINTKTPKRAITEDTAEDITKAIKEGDAVDVAVAENLDDIKPTTVLAPVYGMQIFRNKSIKVFRNVDDVKAADNYVLGTGDQLAVSIWGVAEYEGILTVNKDGYVQPDRMPRIYLRGMTYGKAKEILRAKFSQYYPFKSESFSVTVNYKRTITINIYGEVFTPGGYTIPATNTAFNALVAAGGPSDVGSVRKIKLIREGEKPKAIDVYEFMNNPSIRDKFYLEDNDIIHVPLADRLVTIQGSIKRPYSYELLEGENLMKLIDFAGGLADSAYTEIVQIKRYVNDKQVLIDVKYKELRDTKKDFDLLSGDIVMINKIPKPYDNYANITGAVDFPKAYEIIEGMKIYDLLQKAVLSKDARKDMAFLQRQNPNATFSYTKIDLAAILDNPASPLNLPLKAKDKLIIYSEERFADKFDVSVSGAVRNPQRYPFDASQNLRIEDFVLMAGGIRPDASDIAYVLRRKPEDPTTKQYIRVNLKNVLLNKQSTDNFILQPSDSLFVMSKRESQDVFQIKIDGSVRNPGIYQYDPSLTLKDVLTLSGGILLQGATNRVEVSRVVIKNNEPTRIVVNTLTVDENFETQGGNYKLEPFDQIMVRSVPEFEFQKTIILNGEVMYPGVYTLTSRNETLKDVIERAGGLTPEAFMKGAQLYRKQDNVGYIVMDLSEALKNKNSRFNYYLKAEDEISIPKMKDFVLIQGATRARDLYAGVVAETGQIAAPFHQGKSASYYINEYTGGFSKNAKRADVTVIYPNGKVKGVKNYALFRVYPKPTKGSTIRVAYKDSEQQSKEQKPKEKVDWDKVIAQAIAQASGILTLILLAQQLSK
jgi:protein involved in polysaccharide export with SLBB domain